MTTDPASRPPGSVATPLGAAPRAGLATAKDPAADTAAARAPDASRGEDRGALARHIAADIAEAGGWIGFERYMALALYTPGLGYYSRGDRQFGLLARDGSDFVTAPELSPLFGRALARQVAQALAASGTREVVEFGAGSGALAAQLLGALAELGQPVERYGIVDLSGTLRQRQRETVAARQPEHVHKLHWLDALPERIEGVVVGNELLDAMPVLLLHRAGGRWHERGVAVGPVVAAADGSDPAAPTFAWADRPTELAPPLPGPWPEHSQLELPRQAVAFVQTLAAQLVRGAAFLIDYGFPEHEFYHPQRHAGTLVCHRGHRVDSDPLADPGDKDITAHVDFTAIAVAAQDAGLDVLGYTSQARFLINCGLVADLEAADLRERAMAQKLITEHEMGELFKVIALASPGLDLDPIGFAVGDRSHTL